MQFALSRGDCIGKGTRFPIIVHEERRVRRNAAVRTDINCHVLIERIHEIEIELFKSRRKDAFFQSGKRSRILRIKTVGVDNIVKILFLAPGADLRKHVAIARGTVLFGRKEADRRLDVLRIGGCIRPVRRDIGKRSIEPRAEIKKICNILAVFPIDADVLEIIAHLLPADCKRSERIDEPRQKIHIRIDCTRVVRHNRAIGFRRRIRREVPAQFAVSNVKGLLAGCKIGAPSLISVSRRRSHCIFQLRPVNIGAL